MIFHNLLIKWYLQNKRDLPWRNTTDPYPIWLSEIMLQQTRVAQGLPYFFSFLKAFPTVFDMAKADEQQVLKLWQGLGYYSRARNMHQTAQYIVGAYKGVFPDSYSELMKLKGVGSYTAAAIASFAYNEAVPVVDGNVFRVLSRVFDLETDISSSKAKKEFYDLAFELMPKDQASLFNQAIMEFGALQCVPKSPVCTSCVLNGMCLALKYDKVADLPVKLKTTKVTNRYFNYIVFNDVDGKLLMNKRSAKGIWHNLYEFPLYESDALVSLTTLINEVLPSLGYSKEGIIKISELNQDVIIHKLSHQHLNIKFWQVDLNSVLENGISLEEAKQLPVPIVIHNMIETL